jgi:hypothetical protein
MATSAALTAATEEELGREIIRLVPHWYEAECGPEAYSIPIGQHTAEFYNLGSLTPKLTALYSSICARTRELQLERFLEYPGLSDILLERFASEWLGMHSGETDWVRVINYLETVARRTHENVPVALTLVIRPGSGQEDITRPRLQKFFDRLAASPYTFTYLAVDPSLRLIDYGSVEWSQVNNAASYRFYPEFLHPIHSVMSDTDLVAHLTSRGDLVLMSKVGLLATKRKRKWKVYEASSFEHALAYCLGNRDAAANLLEVVFDLSFRRQGALLVYDPDQRILERILNPESILDGVRGRTGHATRIGPVGQALIASSIDDLAIGAPAGSLRKKRLLIELASIDGAVVFDSNKVLAVGALIRSHPAAGGHSGARATAAQSAHLWGAHPILVSSDGDVTVHFQSQGVDGACDAWMNFL